MRVNFSFLKPKLLNVLITVIILCLPLFREQYNGGQYVTWYKPIDLLIGSLREINTIGLFFLMLAFSLIIYFIVSLVIFKINQRVTNWKK
ncbi:hypothetical protein A2425_00240 [candidate division WWE3 bacterium RIFOXYC1_FULL_42_17]|uniref:Uncharacterized protein n=1 Tax=candidate division WWE3 bacterium RIFOXYB1_FULL_42_27 TaxID=1802638 RepID=A0A1F4W401_UNCKA|nr:MAG: hypothetical protein A2200_02890 [candidate division WWE3 bacterium RIFOXYA1_FULL_41_11]OGC64095.1 MAG: hypothetical protein A2399_02160 [candidate division WWE3 bacterium RIFOXYB1_FULL_42_27]OGC72211.1 MAG: hypothetical protein A2578_00840 [candidate division WWE3 bacterium RIFOXYD1_FULL_42_24]OGC75506.1 MAG: hypothetical protein A2425_00240 [candidate division WWE3 bacterium RIFOXYC1_FULL_42_17]